MKNLLYRKRGLSRSFWRRCVGRRLPLERETTWFILVSALDVFMTYLLLRYSFERRLNVFIIESNPIADRFFRYWGVKGMVAYKFSLVAFVVVAAQIIARKKPETARWLLNVAILVVAGVVTYSLTLLLKHTSLS